MFKKIDEKKKKIDNSRPLPKHTLESIRKEFLLQWTYNSNAIEGNTLTLSETKVVLEDGITIGGKTLKEHLEVINHKEAILYVEEIIRNKKELSQWQIKNIHSLILKGIDDKNAGVYRKEKVIISGEKHIPPAPTQIIEKMENLIDWYGNEGETLHPVEKASKLHTIFVKIHPFIDGNGRTARLLLNFELMKNGYPPVVIKNEDRVIYYESLDKAHTTGDFKDFIDLIEKSLIQSLDLYLRFL